MGSVDPVAAEIHRKAIENLTNEAAYTLVRTSGSPGVTEAKDFSTSVLDAKGEQIGLSAYVLFHSASAMLGVRAVIEQLAADGQTPCPGDGWILNDPYKGGAQHQGDVGIVTPLFYGNELVGWAFANCHVMDIGGSGVGGISPGATTVYEEGIRFPVTHAIRNGQLDLAWERFIAAAVRAPAAVINEIRSMIAANNTAQRKLADVIDHFGLEAHHAYCEHNKDLTEALLRSRIAKLPDGVYEAIDYIEYDGHGVEQLLEVRCSMEVKGGTLRFTFNGSPQVDGFVNGSIGPAYGNVMVMLLTTLGFGDLPFNHGMWRPLEIDIGPPGTVVHAVEPAPVSLGHGEAGMRIGKAVKAVLNQALALSSDPVLRSRVAGVAGDSGVACGLFGLTDAGELRVLAYVDTISGSGGGAQTVADGLDVYGATSMAGCGIPDVELHEATDPVVFLWRRVAQNSSGPGEVRGGNGMDRAYLLRDAAEVSGSAAVFNSIIPAPGHAGGGSPAPGLHHVIRGVDRDKAFATDDLEDGGLGGGEFDQIGIVVGRLTVRRNDVVRAIAGGGAGLGDPLARDAALVAKDVRDGYISRTHGERAYGVMVDADAALDGAATVEARAALRRERLGYAPTRTPRKLDAPGVAVNLFAETRCWTCAHCDTELCGGDQDWREHGTVARTENLAERNRRLEMQSRPRGDGGHIEVHDFFCPGCGWRLASELVTDGKSAAGPQLS